MTDSQAFSAELLRLCGRFRDQAISDEEAQRLSELLTERPEARQFFLRFMGVTSLLEVKLPMQEVDAEGVEADAQVDDLLELLKLEEQGEALSLLETAPSFEQPTSQRREDSLGWRETSGAMRFLLTYSLHSGPVKKLAFAAAVVLAMTLAVVLIINNNTPPGAETAHQPESQTPTPAPPAVATITAVQDAVWALQPGEHVQPGTPLVAGQKLSLSAGFAQITTSRGAIATLQAPCIVELIDHNNALRLHTGKLVGLCETESSKGFTVHTPHGDVVDLGTEFGVLVNAKELTATVFTGEVTLTPPGGLTQPITAHQTAKLKVDGNDRKLVVRDQPAKGFDKVHAVALTKTATLPGTGQAAVGQADPYWSIAAIDGLALLKPVAATVADPTSFSITNRENMRFMPNNSASKWITPLPHYKPSESVEYQATFDASGFDLQTLSLELKFLADKNVTAIELNGRPVDVPTQGIGPAFTEMTELTLREEFVAGQNTLNITVQRHRTPESAGFWTGLRAELQLTSQRPSVGPNE